MAVLRNIAWAASAAALAACAGYPPPKVETPTTFQAAAFQAGDPGSAATAPDARWWSRFKNDELSGFVSEALANNHDLKATIARVLAARAQANAARSAFLPTVNAGASANRSERQSQVLDAGGAVIGTDTRTSSNFSASLQASYQLDVFGQVRNDVAASAQQFESSLYNRVTVEITLVSDVVTTYLQALSARERYSFSERRLANAETLLQLLETQRRIGTLSDLELAQQRSAIANQRASLPALRLAERQSLNALAVLLGRPPEGFDITAKTLSEVSLPQVAAGLPSELLVRRPDLRRAESDFKAANYDVAAARAARLPSFNLNAQGSTSGAALAALFDPGTFLISMGLSASQTLFAGGRLHNQERGARARYLESVELYRQAILSALRDVENALTAVNENGQQYVLAQEAYEQAEYAYKLAELRYRAGAEPFQTVLTAQNSLFQTQESLVQSGLSRFNAAISLTEALGGGWDGTTPEPPPFSLISTSLN